MSTICKIASHISLDQPFPLNQNISILSLKLLPKATFILWLSWQKVCCWMFSLIQLCKNKGFSSLLCGWHGLPGIVIEMDFWRKKGENKFLSCGKYISLCEVFVIVTIQQRWITSWPLGSAPRSHHRKHWSNKYKKKSKQIENNILKRLQKKLIKFSCECL